MCIDGLKKAKTWGQAPNARPRMPILFLTLQGIVKMNLKNKMCLSVIVSLFLLNFALYSGERFFPEIDAFKKNLRNKNSISEQTINATGRLAFKIVSKVPKQGLRASEKELLELISLRKLLETHDDLQAYLLALRMQRLVDCAIYTEMERNQKNLDGKELTPPFQEDSIDKNIAKKLLDANAFPEKNYIDFLKRLDERYAFYINYEKKTKEEYKKAKTKEDQLKAMCGRFYNIQDRKKYQKISQELNTSWVDLDDPFYKKITHVTPDMFFNEVFEVMRNAKKLEIIAEIFEKDGKFPKDKNIYEKRLKEIVPESQAPEWLNKAFPASPQKHKLYNGYARSCSLLFYQEPGKNQYSRIMWQYLEPEDFPENIRAWVKRAKGKISQEEFDRIIKEQIKKQKNAK
jgi:hypothetical protein